MRVSVELLYHYCCDRCRRWWSCGDIQPYEGKLIYCPHCGQENTVEGVDSFAISEKAESGAGALGMRDLRGNNSSANSLGSADLKHPAWRDFGDGETPSPAQLFKRAEPAV